MSEWSNRPLNFLLMGVFFLSGSGREDCCGHAEVREPDRQSQGGPGAVPVAGVVRWRTDPLLRLLWQQDPRVASGRESRTRVKPFAFSKKQQWNFFLPFFERWIWRWGKLLSFLRGWTFNRCFLLFSRAGLNVHYYLTVTKQWRLADVFFSRMGTAMSLFWGNKAVARGSNLTLVAHVFPLFSSRSILNIQIICFWLIRIDIVFWLIDWLIELIFIWLIYGFDWLIEAWMGFLHTLLKLFLFLRVTFFVSLRLGLVYVISLSVDWAKNEEEKLACSLIEFRVDVETSKRMNK